MSNLEPLTLTAVIVLMVAALTPSLARRVRLPVVVIELIVGILIGRSLLDIVPDHELIEFFSTFGVIYIMFLAGLEVDLQEVKKHFSQTMSIALASIAVPFTAGFLITPYLGLDLWPHALLIGTVFSTTSLGLVLPLSRELGFRKRFSHVLLGSVIVVDIISMFLLAFSLSYIEGSFSVSFIFYTCLAMLLFLLPWILKKAGLQNWLVDWLLEESHFETGVRFSFALIAFLAMVSLILGFHAIIGAFVGGLIVSELVGPREVLHRRKSLLEHKLESFGYGFFIPIFFIFVGARTNVPALFADIGTLMILLSIILVGIFSKVVSVTAVSLANGFTATESAAMGFMHCARLSLIIAAVEMGRSLELLNETLYSAFILLALVSAVIGPVIGKRLISTDPEAEATSSPQEDHRYGT